MGLPTLLSYFSNKFSTTQGKVSFALWGVMGFIWIYTFIRVSTRLGDKANVYNFRIWMQNEPVELFPQFAICPMFQQEEKCNFVTNPTCKHRTAGPIESVTKNYVDENPKYSQSCFVFNSKVDLVVGNDSVSCSWLIQCAAKNNSFGDAMIHFSQAGDPNWFWGGNTPNGPNWYRAPRKTWNAIGIEAVSYSNEADGGFKQIKYDHVYNIDPQGLNLPVRAYRAFGKFIPTEHDKKGINDSSAWIYWQTQDLWMYQNHSFFDFWAWVSYIGGTGFLMVMLHSLIFNILKIFVFGDDGTSQ